MKMACPNCQASGKDEHHDEVIEWVGQKDHQKAVITAAATLFLAFMCFIVIGSSWIMASIAAAVVLFVGWRVRKGFEAKSKSYQCNKCETVFQP
jgi:hypothetical protein